MVCLSAEKVNITILLDNYADKFFFLLNFSLIL